MTIAQHIFRNFGASTRTRTKPRRLSLVRMPTRPSRRLRTKQRTRKGTGTKTMTKRINRHSRLNSLQSGSESSVTFRLNKLTRPKFMVAKAAQEIEYCSNYSGTATSGIGQQNVFTVNGLFTTNDYSNIASQLGLYTGPTQLQLEVSRTLGFSNTAASLSRTLTTWQAESNVYITNGSNVPCILKLYDVVFRKGNLGTLNEPSDVWKNTGTGEGSLEGNNRYKIPGETPFNSSFFTKTFKIIRVTDVPLAEGQVHHHFFNHKVKMERNFYADLTYGLDATSTAAVVPYLSCFTIAVFHGTPVADSANTANITLGQCKLNYVNNVKYTVKVPMNSNHYQFDKQTLNTSYSGVGELVQMYNGSTQATLLA